MHHHEIYKDGRDSGYSRCCILYFLFRDWIHRLTGKFIQYPYRIKGAGHIFCPFHFVLYTLVPSKTYHDCTNCNWRQYGIEKCVRCKDCFHKFPPNEPYCTLCGYTRTWKAIQGAEDSHGNFYWKKIY